MMSKNKYILPVREEDVERVIKDIHTHVGKRKNAIDYLVPEGSSIYSAQAGEVVWVKQDSKIGGDNPKYAEYGNFITIKHKNGEYTTYDHLQYGGAKVKVGDKVKKGQEIGYSGNTGQTKGPHLHFEVFKLTGPDKFNDFETLEVKFDDKKSGNLEKIISGIFIFSFLIGLFFSSGNLTGNVIGNSGTGSKFLGIVLVLVGIGGFFVYKKLK